MDSSGGYLITGLGRVQSDKSSINRSNDVLESGEASVCSQVDFQDQMTDADKIYRS